MASRRSRSEMPRAVRKHSFAARNCTDTQEGLMERDHTHATKDDPLKIVFDDPRLPDVVREWRRFESRLRNAQHVALVYHADLDGLLGGVYAQRHLERTLVNITLSRYSVSTDEYDFAGLRDWLDEQRPDSVAFFDISIENNPEILADIAAHVPDGVFVFDHHIMRGPVELPGVHLVSPPPLRLASGERPFPTFYLAAHFARIADAAFPDWLLLMVILAEGVDHWFDDVVRRLLRGLGVPHQSDVRAAYRETDLARINTLIRVGHARRDSAHQLFSTFQDIAQARISTAAQLRGRLEEAYATEADRLSTTIEDLVATWKERLANQEEPARVVLIPIRDSHAVAGPVASVLRGAFPERVVITVVEREDVCILELRTGHESRLNLAHLLREVAAHVPLINYGGHASAAGTMMKKEHLETFAAVASDLAGRPDSYG